MPEELEISAQASVRGVCCKPAVQLPLMGSCEAPLRLLGASHELLIDARHGDGWIIIQTNFRIIGG